MSNQQNDQICDYIIDNNLKECDWCGCKTAILTELRDDDNGDYIQVCQTCYKKLK
jgi:hypothetical protein